MKASLRRRQRFAMFALCLFTAVSLVAAVGNVLVVATVDRGDALVPPDIYYDACGPLVGLTWWLNAIGFTMWLWRAYRSLDALGVSRRFGVGWTVGAWFVPVLNLFRPFQITREIWRAAAAQPLPTPRWLAAWWVAGVSVLPATWLAFVIPAVA